MTGRVSRGDDHFTESERVTIFYFLVLESVLGPAFAADIYLRRFQTRAELARTAHQIGMDVGLENVSDGQTGLARHLDVDVTVRARIENGRDAFVVIADNVGKLRNAFGLDCFENE